MHYPKIAIVGAGPAGLTLARILLEKGIKDVTIFEGETSRHVRSQGGTLDLHEESGLAAIREANLFGEFEKHARYDGEDIQVLDRFGKTWVDIRDVETGRPEIDRVRLREILLDSIPENIVRWGCHLRRAEPGKLHFDHGIEDGFDLIVGADGAWSKIRSLLCDVQPFYSGISGVELYITDIDKEYPKLSEMVGRGSYFAIGEEDERMLMCQRLGDGSLRMYALQKKSENWIKTCGLDLTNPDEVQRSTRQDFASWHPKYLELIDASDNAPSEARALYMLPPGLTWESQPAVTVIGDAAHLMTPFAGEGVNAAMADAMNLALSIVRNSDDIPLAVKNYEAWMFPNAKNMAEKSVQGLQNYTTAGGCARFKAKIDRMIEQARSTDAELKDKLIKTQ